MCQDKLEQILADYAAGDVGLANRRLDMVISSLNNQAVFGRTLAISTGHPYAEENLEEIIEATHPVEIGFTGNGGPFTLMQLKVMQEVITLIIFTVFTTVFFKGEALHWNHLAAFVCLILAVYFVFMK